MKKNDIRYQTYVQILREELIVATGCTEPIAVALAAAKCREILGCIPESVSLKVSGSILKNVKSVVVPNTGHRKGIKVAAAAGIIAGDAAKGLDVISSVPDEKIDQIQKFAAEADIKVDCIDQGVSFDIWITEIGNGHTATVRIVNSHTNIAYIEKDGRILKNLPVSAKEDTTAADRSLLDVDGIWDFTNTCDLNDVKPMLDPQIKDNMAIAEEGIKGNYGARIGAILHETGGNSPENLSTAKAAAGSDARMDGCEMPVVINSGSGNQGITCSVPVIEYGKQLGKTDEQIYRALVLSNLLTIYERNGIGKLSAYCGAVCAGSAAGAAIAYLNGADKEKIASSVSNALAILSGVSCDGAKASCAAKIAMSVKAGILASDMAERDDQFRGGDGIVADNADKTISNVGRLGREGMKETNEEIIQIMLNDK